MNCCDDRGCEGTKSGKRQVFFANLEVVNSTCSQLACLSEERLRTIFLGSGEEGALGDGIEQHLRAN